MKYLWMVWSPELFTKSRWYGIDYGCVYHETMQTSCVSFNFISNPQVLVDILLNRQSERFFYLVNIISGADIVDIWQLTCLRFRSKYFWEENSWQSVLFLQISSVYCLGQLREAMWTYWRLLLKEGLTSPSKIRGGWVSETILHTAD